MWDQGGQPWPQWPLSQQQWMQSFQHQQDPGQVDWAALAQAWIAQKESTGPEQPSIQPNGQDIPGLESVGPGNHGAFQGEPAFGRMWQPEWGMHGQPPPPPPPPPPEQPWIPPGSGPMDVVNPSEDSNSQDSVEFNTEAHHGVYPQNSHGYGAQPDSYAMAPMAMNQFDYQHGAASSFAPTSTSFHSPYWQGPPQNRRDTRPPGFRDRPRSPIQLPVKQEAPATLDAVKRRTLPAWIREGLEKMDREKQKKLERERMEKERSKMAKVEGKEHEADEEGNGPRVPRKSKFDSDDEGNDDNDEEEKVSVVKKEFGGRSPSPPAEDSEPEMTDEEKEFQLMIITKTLLTEILLEVTNEEIQHVAKETHRKATRGFLRGWGCLRSVHNMLNIPTQSFPAPCSQQRVAPSGREKAALKPGHSLMDWIRFSKSGKDLTGLRGRLIEVTKEELQKHNTRDDCWTCIRGMVYNVTPYMDYHPGGEAELMKAAGIDGTDLFDQVHRWVNYESMLKECLVGRMATPVLKAFIPPPPPTSLAPPMSVSAPPDKDSRPRYDWFQTDVTVHLVVYAKRKIPSSGCTIVDLKAGVLRLEVLLGKMSYMIHLRLADEVEGNIAVHTAFSVGKIQVTIRKQAKAKWTSLGQPLEFHNTFLRKNDRALHYRDCVLVSKTEVNHNTHVFRLQLPRGTVMHVPVGKHVYLKALIQDTEVVRPYTPVGENLAAASHNSPQESDLYLMVKVYPDGVFTPHLNSLSIGDCISVSGPEGTFSLRPLRDVTHLYLLAAGTGFTPMARLIQLVLQDVDSIRKIKLLFFNRREEDILWRCDLDQLAADNERFQVEYVLSDPSESWSGRTGRVDESMLKDILIRPDASKSYVCVCGPTAFTELTMGLLKQQGFSEEELHAFQG